MIVPAATSLDAVTEHELPAELDVPQEIISLPIDQISVVVDGLTEASTQVVDAPV
jgi:hypothetical protein